MGRLQAQRRVATHATTAGPGAIAVATTVRPEFARRGIAAWRPPRDLAAGAIEWYNRSGGMVDGQSRCAPGAMRSKILGGEKKRPKEHETAAIISEYRNAA